MVQTQGRAPATPPGYVLPLSMHAPVAACLCAQAWGDLGHSFHSHTHHHSTERLHAFPNTRERSRCFPACIPQHGLPASSPTNVSDSCRGCIPSLPLPKPPAMHILSLVPMPGLVMNPLPTTCSKGLCPHSEVVCVFTNPLPSKHTPQMCFHPLPCPLLMHTSTALTCFPDALHVSVAPDTSDAVHSSTATYTPFSLCLHEGTPTCSRCSACMHCPLTHMSHACELCAVPLCLPTVWW